MVLDEAFGGVIRSEIVQEKGTDRVWSRYKLGDGYIGFARDYGSRKLQVATFSLRGAILMQVIIS